MTGIVAALGSTRRNLYYVQGLYRRTYSGYFNDDVNYFDNATPTASAADTSPIAPPSNVNLTSYQWLGYWLATSDTVSGGSTFFQTASDDGSWLWIGLTAVTGYTTGNALINNGGLRSDVQTVSASTPLTVGQYYPIRLQYGANTAGSLQFSVFSTSVNNYTTNVANNVFYNGVTLGL